MNDEKSAELIKRGICPRCKRELAHTEGCLECGYCGWSECPES